MPGLTEARVPEDENRSIVDQHVDAAGAARGALHRRADVVFFEISVGTKIARPPFADSKGN
jgi:hypothetical protein